jgi:trehalose 6-phosphate synthase
VEKLVIVSNRVLLPRERSARAGGLAVGVGYILRRHGGLWFGWSGEIAEETSTTPRITRAGETTFAAVDLGRLDYQEYYSGFANGTLWPLCHYRLGMLEYSRQEFDGYRRVNAIFARSRLSPHSLRR